MRIALLNPDPMSVRLVQSVITSGQCQLAAIFDANDLEPEVRARLGMPASSEWERLLHAPDCDVTVIGRSHWASDRRQEQLRKLAQAGMPLVVMHPACEVLLGFELQMIQQDVGGPIIPYLPGLQHPFLQRLAWRMAEVANAGDEAWQAVIDRRLPDGDQQTVLTEFSRDALLLRRLVGRIDRLMPWGPSPTHRPIGPA